MRRAIRFLAGLAIACALSGAMTLCGMLAMIRSDGIYCRLTAQGPCGR